MYIEITSDIPDRQLKAGHRFHEKYEYAVCLIALGKAKEVRDPNTAESQEGDSALGSTNVGFFPKPVWCVAKHPVNGEIHVVKKFCSEIAWYQNPLPADCPSYVAELYREMVAKDNPGAQFAAKVQQMNEVER